MDPTGWLRACGLVGWRADPLSDVSGDGSFGMGQPGPQHDPHSGPPSLSSACARNALPQEMEEAVAMEPFPRYWAFLICKSLRLSLVPSEATLPPPHPFLLLAVWDSVLVLTTRAHSAADFVSRSVKCLFKMAFGVASWGLPLNQLLLPRLAGGCAILLPGGGFNIQSGLFCPRFGLNPRISSDQARTDL